MATLREQNEQAEIVSSVSHVRKVIASQGLAEVRPSSRIASRLNRTANYIGGSGSYGYGFGGGGGGGGGGFGGGAGVTMGSATNVYSPQLSTDFLELPQNLAEMRSYYRFFYNNDPYVQQAVILHTELPLSKLRLTMPKGTDAKKNREILRFYEEMVKKIDLLNVLVDATREFYVIGEAFLFAEDTEPEVPEYVFTETLNHLDTETGETSMRVVRRSDAEEAIATYRQAHYRGWDRVIILPPDQVSLETYSFSHKYKVELIPDGATQGLVKAAMAGDESAIEALEDVPEQIIEYISQDMNLPLGTDPEKGSFVYHLSRNRQAGKDHGESILQSVMRTLVYRDKLRQAQTSIASRAMTPKRLVYAEDMSLADVEDLREQVDLLLMDPDYSLITNFQVTWEEISARDRLLDLAGEYDITDRQLFAGLGVTQSMLTGESSYSGERINIEVINTRYMLYRERIQQYVEENLFRPVAIKKGYTEVDEFGNLVVLYPELSFTRLALRDNRDTFDAMFNLYQKGSLSVGYILELFNLDPQAVEERLRQDFLTMNDSLFNEILRSSYSEVGRALPEQTDLLERTADYLKLSYSPPKDTNSRFGSVQGSQPSPGVIPSSVQDLASYITGALQSNPQLGEQVRRMMSASHTQREDKTDDTP